MKEWKRKGGQPRIAVLCLLSQDLGLPAHACVCVSSDLADQLDRFLPARVQPSVCVLTAPLFHH